MSSSNIESQSIGFPGYGFGYGFGNNHEGSSLAAGLALGTALHRRGDDCGRGRDDRHCDRAVFDAAILGKLGTIEGAVPLATAHVRESVAAAADSIKANSNAHTLFLGNAIDRSKDHLCSAIEGVDRDVLVGTARGIEVTREEGDKTRTVLSAILINRFQHEDAQALADLRARLLATESDRRFDGRSRDVEVNVAQTVTQTQAQAQAQAQFQLLADLAASVRNLAGDLQVVKQAQSNINFGVQAGTTQASNATNNRVS